MVLPGEARERIALYRNIAREAARSRDDRRERYRQNRIWYLTGSQSADAAKYNKIKSHVAASSAYLYTLESVRWGVTLPPRYADRWIEEEEAAREEWQRLFATTGADLIFGAGVEWAHVWDSTVFKVIMDRGLPSLELVPDPSDVCVWQESEFRWNKQEAIVHFYDLEESAFHRLIGGIDDAKYRDLLLMEAREHAAPRADTASSFTLPPTMSRIVLAASSPSAIGSIRGPVSPLLAQPRDGGNVVKLAELWVWDDLAVPLCDKCRTSPRYRLHARGHDLYDHDFEAGAHFQAEWRVVTIVLPTERMLWEPLNPLEPQTHPFHGLTLNPTPGYLWGIAPITYLTQLQTLRTEQMDDANELIGKQSDPPIVATGVSGIQDERLKVLRKRGGTWTNPMPGGKVEPFLVPMPADAFGAIKETDAMFADQGGLPGTVRGETQPGIRSGDQAMTQAMLGAGPTMAKAMLVERCLEQVATQMLRLWRRANPTTLTTITGREFLLSQMPGDITVSVSAHSASPLYSQQIAEKAVIAKQSNAIGNDDFVRLLQLPQDDQLAAKARKIAALSAEAAKQQMSNERMKAEADKKQADAKMIQAMTP